MATYFVSNAGSNTAPYDTEAKAATSLSTIAALPWAATDTVYVSSTHAESTAGAISYTFPTTTGLKILCVLFNGTGAYTAPTTGAVITNSTDNTAITFVSGYAYVYGIQWTAPSTASAGNTMTIQSTGNTTGGMIFTSCIFRFPGSSTSSRLIIGNTSSLRDIYLHLINCTHSALAGGNRNILCRNVEVYIENFSYICDSGQPTTMFNVGSTNSGSFTIVSSDFSNLASTNLLQVSADITPSTFRMIGCKIPAFTNITVDSHVGPNTLQIELIDCASGDTQYQYLLDNYMGRIEVVNSIYTDSSNGTDSLSLKMVSSANASFQTPLIAPPISYFNPTLSAMTTTVEVVSDNVTFTDAELWQETLAKVTSGFALATLNVADRVANVLATPAAQTSSSVVWTGTGAFSPEVKQKLVSGSFTPAEVGMIQTTVKLAKASATVYVSQKITTGARQYLTYNGGIINEPWEVVAAILLKHDISRLQAGAAVVGTYRGYDLWESLPASKIEIGEDALQDGEILVGTHAATDRYTDLDPAVVLVNEVWRYNSLENNRTGTLEATCDYSEVEDTRLGTVYADGARTGTLDLAAAADLRLGVTQDNGNIVGELVTDRGEAECVVTEETLICALGE